MPELIPNAYSPVGSLAHGGREGLVSSANQEEAAEVETSSSSVMAFGGPRSTRAMVLENQHSHGGWLLLSPSIGSWAWQCHIPCHHPKCCAAVGLQQCIHEVVGQGVRHGLLQPFPSRRGLHSASLPCNATTRSVCCHCALPLAVHRAAVVLGSVDKHPYRAASHTWAWCWEPRVGWRGAGLHCQHCSFPGCADRWFGVGFFSYVLLLFFFPSY